jgi:hypothetical protein
MIEIYVGLAIITTAFLIFAILAKPTERQPRHEK